MSATFGEVCFDALARERARLGTLNKAAWVTIVNQLVESEKIFRKRKPAAKGEPKPGRPRNELFDALAVATGTRDLSKLTRNGARVIAVALADIRAVEPDLTVEKIQTIVTAYSRMWTDPRNLSAPAVAKHWAEFAGTLATRTAKTDIYQEPVGPWRQVARSLYPTATDWISPHNFSIMPWSEVSLAIRADILRAI